ncbi:hypothetical protein PS726_04389 [Pseudomonas fluorescens]|nr:hypothetical protein PS726_04389 [Pseudomonas fluorescens]
MGDINISRVETDALKGGDTEVLDKPIERSLYEE